jgi:alanine dehydrogenase
VIHYAVANIPGAVPRTTTVALTNATLGYIEGLAETGWRNAIRKHADLARGVNVLGGEIVYQAIAEAHSLKPHSLGRLL